MTTRKNNLEHMLDYFIIYMGVNVTWLCIRGLPWGNPWVLRKQQASYWRFYIAMIFLILLSERILKTVPCYSKKKKKKKMIIQTIQCRSPCSVIFSFPAQAIICVGHKFPICGFLSIYWCIHIFGPGLYLLNIPEMWIPLYILMYPHFWPRLIFVVYSRNADSSLYTDVCTFFGPGYELL